jgi:ABC-type transporter MlaC component
MGYGDADPLNVSPLVHGAEMRIAETRAVNRALRKAYGIGICSVEEIGSFSRPVQTKSQSKNETKKLLSQPENGDGIKGNSTRVRDRLCQIIRQHQLDPVLVKAYAVNFCGTKTLREAKREQVESFVTHISNWAQKDINALLCQFNSYLHPQEGAA